MDYATLEAYDYFIAPKHDVDVVYLIGSRLAYVGIVSYTLSIHAKPTRYTYTLLARMCACTYEASYVYKSAIV